ncbi:MAG TPA: hypothetical protein VFG35_13905, partial [Actinoplanes sp.]|nr:hypothetical protein [Actinoplanes sp.]
MTSRWLRVAGWCLAAAIAVALVATVVTAFGPLPRAVLGGDADALSAADQIKARNDVRASLLQAVGGVLLVIGAITAWRQMLIGRRQHLLSRRTAITESFTKALDSLGDTNSAAVRLGGVYSLDRVADDDPAERDRVAEVLSAF